MGPELMPTLPVQMQGQHTFLDVPQHRILHYWAKLSAGSGSLDNKGAQTQCPTASLDVVVLSHH